MVGRGSHFTRRHAAIRARRVFWRRSFPDRQFNGFYSLNAASDNRNAKSVGLRLWKVCIVRVNLFELSLFRSF